MATAIGRARNWLSRVEAGALPSVDALAAVVTELHIDAAAVGVALGGCGFVGVEVRA